MFSKGIIEFNNKWVFDIHVPSNSYALPTFQVTGGNGVALYIDWGDMTTSTLITNGSAQTVSKTYATSGTYTVTVTGGINAISMLTTYFPIFCNIGTMPIGINDLEIRDYLISNVNGNVTDININVVGLYLFGVSTLTGDLSNFSNNISTITLVSPYTTIVGNIANLKSNIIRYYDAGDGVYTGDIANLKSTLTQFTKNGANTITGDIANLKSNLNTLSITGSNTITGDIANLKPVMTTFSLSGNNTVGGDFANLPSTCTFFALRNGRVNTYNGKTWTNMQLFLYNPSSPYGLNATQCANLIIDISLATWSGTNVLQLLGSNATPTPSSALTTAKALLVSKGVSVTTN